jgi:NADH dehydrogenase [ubiquinone] 1 alpha subcomplex assembly factor 7
MLYDPNARRDTPLAEIIKAIIRADGPIELSQYVQLCLWHDQHGYYATRQVLGKDGDFITAPEISQVFGELIGLWAAVVWQSMGSPSAFTLVEAGPGRGTLMADALRATAKVPGFHGAMTVHLVEASPTLKALQEARLANSGVPIAWSQYGEGLVGPRIVIANEFLDCFPVDQAVLTEGRWRLRCVGLDSEGQLTFADRPNLRDFPHFHGLFPAAAEGSVVEFVAHPSAPFLETGVTGAGHPDAPVAGLFFDYGHEGSGLGETLQAVRNHRYEHILTSPGEADLSAHVNFTDVAAAAQKAGLVAERIVTQAELLGRIGIIERLQTLMSKNPSKAAALETAVARLLQPQGMGGRFKALGLRSAKLPPLPGF